VTLAVVAKYIEPGDRTIARQIKRLAHSTQAAVAAVLRNSMAKLAAALGV
jgi:hypothetical protein